MEDNVIVDMYLVRDEDAPLYTQIKYGARLRAIAAGVLGSPEDADEALNDTLLAAWNAIPPHRPHGYLFPFLARITRCKAIDRGRQSKRSSDMLVELTDELSACIPDGSDTEEAVLGAELGTLIDDFLSSLRYEQRIIFVRRYFYSDSISHIAELLGCGESRVKTSLKRSRDRLRAFLSDKLYGDFIIE